MEALLPADGAIADVMEPVTPPRSLQLSEKLQRAIRKQPEWWLDQVRKAKPGEPLPYDPRLGLTRAEYQEFLALARAYTLKKAGTVKLHIRREGKRITLDGGEQLPELKGVELDLTTRAVKTPFGTAAHGDRITASPEQTALGPWDGIEWKLEKMNEQTLTGTIVTFDLGRLQNTRRGLLRYEVKQITEQSRTDFSLLLEYDLPVK